jgi:hypothetical protein
MQILATLTQKHFFQQFLMPIQMQSELANAFVSQAMFQIPSILHLGVASAIVVGRHKIFALPKNPHLCNWAQPQLRATFPRTST